MPFVFKEEVALVHKSLSVLSDFSVKFFKSLSVFVSPAFSQLRQSVVSGDDFGGAWAQSPVF